MYGLAGFFKKTLGCGKDCVSANNTCFGKTDKRGTEMPEVSFRSSGFVATDTAQDVQMFLQ